MTSGVRSVDLAALDLGERAGDPLATAHRVLVEGAATVGVWEAGPGTDDDVEADEAFLVLDGAGTVRFEDGEVVALAPGVLVRLRAGERTTWEITERLRKVYVTAANDDADSSGAAGRRVLAADAASVAVAGSSHSGHWVEGGWPSASADVLDRLGPTRVGLWETTSGVSADIERDEVLVVLAGSGEVYFESDSATLALRPGTLLRLHEGERTEWTVHADLRALSLTL